jgi:hypothetical protein
MINFSIEDALQFALKYSYDHSIPYIKLIKESK